MELTYRVDFIKLKFCQMHSTYNMKTSIFLAISLVSLISAGEPKLFSPQNNLVLSKLTEVKQASLLNLQSKQDNPQEPDLVDIDLEQFVDKFKQEIEELRLKLTQIILSSKEDAEKAIVQFKQCIEEGQVLDTVFKELLTWTANQCKLDSLDDLVEKLISYNVDWIKQVSENCVTIDDEIKAKLDGVFKKGVEDVSGFLKDNKEVKSEPTQMLDISAFAELNSHKSLEEILGDLDQLDEKLENFIAELRNLLQQEVAELCSQAYDLLVKLATSAAQKQ